MSKYYLVDTNVLLAASGMATHLGKSQVTTVRDWLTKFQQDRDAFLLFDSEGSPALTKSRILEEYLRKMPKNAFGWQVIKAKIDARSYRCYRVAYEGTPLHEYAVLVPTLTRGWIDPSDRKFIAVALEHIKAYPRQRCRIVNATDQDWSQCASTLYQHNVEIEQLLP
ncbi:MAG TPA: hypothetical protein VE262_09280 [Blastocatellia bacterium]|nr:hypothetical protein [Blastocatellia bacterium]